MSREPVEQIGVVHGAAVHRAVRIRTLKNALERHLEFLAGPGVGDAGRLDDVVGHMPRRGLLANRGTDTLPQRVVEFRPPSDRTTNSGIQYPPSARSTPTTSASATSGSFSTTW